MSNTNKMHQANQKHNKNNQDTTHQKHINSRETHSIEATTKQRTPNQTKRSKPNRMKSEHNKTTTIK